MIQIQGRRTEVILGNGITQTSPTHPLYLGLPWCGFHEVRSPLPACSLSLLLVTHWGTECSPQVLFTGTNTPSYLVIAGALGSREHRGGWGLSASAPPPLLGGSSSCRPALGGWMVDRQISKASVLSCPCEETVTARGPVTQRRGRRGCGRTGGTCPPGSLADRDAVLPLSSH